MSHSIPIVGCEVPRDEVETLHHCKVCVAECVSPECPECGETASEGPLSYAACMLCGELFTESERDAGGWWTEDGPEDLSCPKCVEENL